MHYLRAVLQALWRFALGFWRLLPRRAQQMVAVIVLLLAVVNLFPGLMQLLFCLAILGLLWSFIIRGIRSNLGFGGHGRRRRH